MSISFLSSTRTICIFTGVLPVKKKRTKDVDKLQSENSINPYKISYHGLLLWIALIMVNCYMISHSYKKFMIYANNHVQTCFQMNFCLSLVERVLINIQPLVPVLSTFYKFKLKLRCIEQAEYFYEILCTKKLSKHPLYIFISFQCVALISYSIKDRNMPIWHIFMHIYCYIGVISLDCLILMFCYIIEKTYKHINDEIDAMISLGKIDKSHFIVLEKKHWQNGNFLNELNTCFGLNLLFFWPYNIVHTITFLMFITDARNYPIILNAEIFNEMVNLTIFLIGLIYYGKTGTSLTKEAERTNVCIEKLKLVYSSKLDDSILKLIKIFNLKLNSRKMLLTAAGFLKIDMSIIQSFLGLILTYWIVLVQFRSSD